MCPLMLSTIDRYLAHEVDMQRAVSLLIIFDMIGRALLVTVRVRRSRLSDGGFSLAEVLVAAGIAVVFMGLVVGAVAWMGRASNQTQDSSNSESVLLDATNRITRDVSYATRIIRAEPDILKVETTENDECRRSMWAVRPATGPDGQPRYRQGEGGSTTTEPQLELVNTIEQYPGICPDDARAQFADDNTLTDTTKTPVVETHVVVPDFDRHFDGGVTAKNLAATGADPFTQAPPIFEYFDKADNTITGTDTPASFIRRVRFTVATTTEDRTNPLKISTSAVPFAGGDPSYTGDAIQVPLAPTLGAVPAPLTLPEQHEYLSPDGQWISLAWTNPTPALTTGYILMRYAPANQGEQPVQVQLLESIDPFTTAFEDRTLPRGTCARYQVFANTTKGMSAGSNYRDVCMPPEPVKNLTSTVANCSIDDTTTTTNEHVIGVNEDNPFDFSRHNVNAGRCDVTLHWDAVYADRALGLGYNIYYNDALVAVLNAQAGAWDRHGNDNAYTASPSRSIAPPAKDTALTWTVTVPLDHDDTFRVTPFGFWQNNQGAAQRIDAYDITMRPDLTTEWGSTVHAVTTPAPVTVRHSYASPTQVTLTWNDTHTERGYRIYRSTMTDASNTLATVSDPTTYNWVHTPTLTETDGHDANTEWGLVGETTSTRFTTDTGALPAGSKYVYKVIAWNRPGMFPRTINAAFNPEQWLPDNGGPVYTTTTPHAELMARTINTTFGRPTATANLDCKVNLNTRDVAVSIAPGVLYPEQARMEIYRSGTTDQSNQGRHVHTQREQFGGLGFLINANNNPTDAPGTLPKTLTGGSVVSRYNQASASANGFGQTVNNPDANAQPLTPVADTIPAAVFGPGTTGENPDTAAGINQGGGRWTIPASMTRWGDTFRARFITTNENGDSAPTDVSCYIPMPVAPTTGIYNPTTGWLNTKDSTPADTATAEAAYYNNPGLTGSQENNYRATWTWAGVDGTYAYPQAATPSHRAATLQYDDGYQYWMYFTPTNRNPASKGSPWVPGQPLTCGTDPLNNGDATGTVVKLPATARTHTTASDMVAAGAAGSQRAWDHDVWLYAVNLETGKRILTSTTCGAKGGTPGKGKGTPDEFTSSTEQVEVYGIPTPNPYVNNPSLIGEDVGMNLGRIAVDIYKNEFLDFDSVARIENTGQAWPNPLPATYTLKVCNRNLGSVVRAGQKCNNLTTNPNNNQNGFNVPWVNGKNTMELDEELTPGFPYQYTLTFKNQFGETPIATNTDFTYPFRNILLSGTGTMWVGKARAYWYDNGDASAIGFSHQLGNLVQFWFRRAEDNTRGTVTNKLKPRQQGGPLALVGRADYIQVDGLGLFAANTYQVHNSFGAFYRGGRTCLQGGRGLYCTDTWNGWHTGPNSYGAPNLNAPGVSMSRADGSNSDNTSTTAIPRVSAGASTCRAFSKLSGGIDATRPQSGTNGPRSDCTFDVGTLSLPNPGLGTWSCADQYNEVCTYIPSYSSANASAAVAAVSHTSCDARYGDDSPAEEDGCWKHSPYSATQMTFVRMSDKNNNPRPAVKPRPSPSPTPTKKKK